MFGVRFSEDAGLDATDMVKRFGYGSFHDFLTSELMRDCVQLMKGNTYRAVPHKRYKQVSDEMAVSFRRECEE